MLLVDAVIFDICSMAIESTPYSDDQIRQVATEFTQLLETAKQLAPTAESRLITGARSTVFMKKKGQRELSEEDIQNLIGRYGDEHQKQLFDLFPEVQKALTARLQETKYIGLILEQADIPYPQYFTRIERPDLWKPDQILRIIDVLKRLQL